jgi:molybdenum cofactor synthesis domain-containing protein
LSADIEIICVGNELLIGKIENTNAYWLTKQITTLGANVIRITVIRDIVEEIARCILEARARRPQFIITTGGLGPTFDDKTFQGIAKALNQELVVNQEALEMVKQKCIEYAIKLQMPAEIELTPPRVKMAIFPEGTEPVINPIGTAPALFTNMDGTLLFALPGIPKEMELIFSKTIAPQIKQAVGENIFCERCIFADNIFESRLAPLIDKVMSNNVGVYVKSHPITSKNKSQVELHLTIVANKTQKPAEKLLKAEKELRSLIESNGGNSQ